MILVDFGGSHNLMLAAVTRDGHVLWYASEALKEDREFVLTAVTKNGIALSNVSTALTGYNLFCLSFLMQISPHLW